MSRITRTRLWDTPVAIALSIRSTAATVGPGGDNFMKVDILPRPGVAPAAPLADVGARPVLAETVKAGGTDQRSWEGPAVTTLVI